MSTEKLFDVVIYEIATRKIESVIGRNMKRWDGSGSGRNTADLRQQTGRERVNDRYDVEIIEAGKFKVGDAIPGEPDVKGYAEWEASLQPGERGRTT